MTGNSNDIGVLRVVDDLASIHCYKHVASFSEVGCLNTGDTFIVLGFEQEDAKILSRFGLVFAETFLVFLAASRADGEAG